MPGVHSICANDSKNLQKCLPGRTGAGCREEKFIEFDTVKKVENSPLFLHSTHLGSFIVRCLIAGKPSFKLDY
jgi:hypothetical protein